MIEFNMPASKLRIKVFEAIENNVETRKDEGQSYLWGVGDAVDDIIDAIIAELPSHAPETLMETSKLVANGYNAALDDVKNKLETVKDIK
jgi:hypothetical protein